MLHDELREYKGYLMGRYSRETAATYYKRLAVLFEGQPVANTAARLDPEKVLEKLGAIKHKNHFSQSKNSFLHFCEFQGIKLSDSILAGIKELEGKAKKKHRKLKAVDFAEVENKIKRLRNMKLKLSYQTIIATGLHVSELAGLSPKDCAVSGNSITFSFIGKGGKNGTAAISANDSPLLHERLKSLIENTPVEKKVFYSAVYLQKKATELGFTCHDLRRAFAKLEYKKCRNKAEVSEKLNHSSVRTTNIYFRSKVKV